MGIPRIVLYGHFGSGNVGNDSTLEAMLYNIQKVQPTTIITCICSGPQIIAKRFKINTLPINIAEHGMGNHPSRRNASFLKRVLNRCVDEFRFWLKQPAWFRSIDQFIVVGTGAVDDAAVRRTWNAPYDLYKWCKAAKIGGARVVFLSVGVGPIMNRLNRILMLKALRMADYRSYRETESFDYLRSVGFDTDGDVLFPDLVFSLPEELLNLPGKSSDSPMRVGLGVITYYGWRHDPQIGETIYQDYLSKMKRFVSWLLEKGFSVRIIAGDTVDQRPINDLLDFVIKEGNTHWKENFIAEKIATVNDLFNQIAGTDVVVASRFHNVLCALMLERPVVSLGYHIKNESLMAEMGLQEYCQHIENFDVDRLILHFKSLVALYDQATIRIQKKRREYRQKLDEQYDYILGSKAGNGSTVSA
jgi:polysaccharide pyruvyl transferase WcaK-like protein